MMNVKQNIGQKGREYIWVFLLLSALLLAGCNMAVKETPLAEDVDAANLGRAVFRINVGVNRATTINGVRWEADKYFWSKSRTYSTTTTISGTDSQELYQTGRTPDASRHDFWYWLPVQPGRYLVRLHFAEVEHGKLGSASSK